jgi:hypothetical protein
MTMSDMDSEDGIEEISDDDDEAPQLHEVLSKVNKKRRIGE